MTLNPSVAHLFWIPDIFLDRAKEIRVPTYFTKPASLRIYSDSTMRYSRLGRKNSREMEITRADKKSEERDHRF